LVKDFVALADLVSDIGEGEQNVLGPLNEFVVNDKEFPDTLRQSLDVFRCDVRSSTRRLQGSSSLTHYMLGLGKFINGYLAEGGDGKGEAERHFLTEAGNLPAHQAQFLAEGGVSTFYLADCSEGSARVARIFYREDL
jgi:hypothetical protein